MIIFMAMPFIFGLWNIVVPLQIGARDVAFPVLNNVSFWLFFAGMILFNLSFIIGGSPAAGWTNYAPLAGEFSPGPGVNYYLIAIQISGLGTLATGINFFVTILRCKTPTMKFMQMPMFTVTTFITTLIVILAFPPLTVALALMTTDRIFDTAFFTVAHGGMPMLWANFFWVWGTLKFISLSFQHLVFTQKLSRHSLVSVYSDIKVWYGQLPISRSLVS